MILYDNLSSGPLNRGARMDGASRAARRAIPLVVGRTSLKFIFMIHSSHCSSQDFGDESNTAMYSAANPSSAESDTDSNRADSVASLLEDRCEDVGAASGVLAAEFCGAQHGQWKIVIGAQHGQG